jgi:hypothetical protein
VNVIHEGQSRHCSAAEIIDCQTTWFRTPNASQRQLPRCADQAGVRRAPVGAVVRSFTSTLGALKQILPVPTPTLYRSHSVVVKASRHSWREVVVVSSARGDLWSRDRGCYVWVVLVVIAGRVRANRLFAIVVVSVDRWQSLAMHWITYDLALVFLLLRLRRRVRFFLHLALILGCWKGCQSLIVMTARQMPLGASIYSHLLRMRWDE